MRSLTSLLLLHGDPSWYRSVAPVVRYAKGVFSNQVRSSPYTLSFGVLREAWESAYGVPKEELAWKKVTGPLSALRLSLFRIQWDMKSFCVMVNDCGADIISTPCSPALIKQMLHDG
eukprot:1759058-Pyramimonas_sp.AAC.1